MYIYSHKVHRAMTNYMDEIKGLRGAIKTPQIAFVDMFGMYSHAAGSPDICGRAYVVAICRRIIRAYHSAPGYGDLSDTELLAFFGMPDAKRYTMFDARVAAAIVLDQCEEATCYVNRIWYDHCTKQGGDSCDFSAGQMAHMAQIAQAAKLIVSAHAALTQTAPLTRTGVDGFLDEIKIGASKPPAERMFGDVTSVPATEFYNKYREWAVATNNQPILSAHQFGRIVKARIQSSRLTRGVVYRIARIEP